jgi:tetratricopeptide (TPR) repeat protein
MNFRFHPAAAWGGLLLVFLSLPAAAKNLPESTPVPSTRIDHYRQVLLVEPGNLSLHYFLGEALLGSDRPEEAKAEFRRAYPAFPESVEINYNLALACYRTGDPDSSMIYLERAEALGAREKPALFPLGDLYFNLGLEYMEAENQDEAIRSFKEALSFDPDRLEIHPLLGDIFARRGQIERALVEFGLFLQGCPEDSQAREYVYALHFNRGRQLLEKKDFSAARQEFEKALAIAPDSPLALYYLGYADYSEGLFEGAAERLNAAYRGSAGEIRESIAPMLYNTALGLLEQDEPRSALTAVEPLAARTDSAPEYLYLAGNIHLALGEFNRARLLYRRILETDPAHRGAAVNLQTAETGSVEEMLEKARVLLGQRAYREARAALDTALAIAPSDERLRACEVEIRAALQQGAAEAFGQAEKDEAAGQFRKALAQVREGLKLVTGSSRGTMLEERLLGRLDGQIEQILVRSRTCLEQNRLGEALRAFEQVLKLDPDHPDALKGRERTVARRHEQALAAVEEGDRALAEGRLEAARKAFSAALRLEPDQPDGKDGLDRADALVSGMVDEALQWGRRAKAGGDLEQARKHFTDALELRDTPLIRRELADLDRLLAERLACLRAAVRAALEKGLFKRARNHLGRILELAPDDPEALGELAGLDRRQAEAIEKTLVEASSQLKAGKAEEAMAGYRRILDLDPGNLTARQGLHQAQSMVGEALTQIVADGETALADRRWDDAATAFDRALTLDPYQPDAIKGRVRLHRMQRLEGETDDPEQVFLQGIELYTRGRYEEAIAAWQGVLTLAPDHEEARVDIERARRKLGQKAVSRGG